MTNESQPTDKTKPFFRFRLNNIDCYQAPPTGLDYPVILSKPTPPGKKVKAELPVVRVFGSTETGQRVCAHIHGVFPYVYVEYGGILEPQEVTKYIYRLHASLDHALCVSLKRNAMDPKNVFIARITLCKGVPFFGFNVGWKYYLKIYSLQSRFMRRLTTMLRDGAVMSTKFLVYEAHIQYLLQFMIDYNLYGCGYINCATGRFRMPLPSTKEAEAGHDWHEGTIPTRVRLTKEEDFPRTSFCALEVDIQAHDILNRLDVKARSLHHDFVERLNPYSPDQKLVPSMAELWKDETRRRKEKGLTTESFGVSFSVEARKLHGGWIHEQEYRTKIDELIAFEHARSDGSSVKWDNFVKHDDFEKSVKTTWESVEDFYPGTTAPEEHRYPSALMKNETGIDVDVHALEDTEENGDDVGRGAAPQDAQDGHPDDAVEEDPSKVILGEAELAEWGVLTEEQFQSWRRHNFVVPIQYFSRGPPPPRKRVARAIDATSRPPHKRQKLVEDALEEGIESSDTEKALMASLNSAHSSPSKKPWQSPKTPGRVSFLENEFSPTQDTPRGPRIQSQMKHMQSSLKSYQYPVVKDPGPETMRRLSQETSSQKSSPLKSSISPRKDQNSKSSASFGDVSILTAFDSQKSLEKQLVALSQNMQQSFMTDRAPLCFNSKPPTATEAIDSMEEYGLPLIVYQEAFYSNEIDVPERRREYAGREFRLESNTVPYLPDFDPLGEAESTPSKKKVNFGPPPRAWEIAAAPPSRKEVEEWLENEAVVQAAKEAVEFTSRNMDFLSQIEGPTQRNKHGFKFSQKNKSSSVAHEIQHMSIMSLEIHVNTRGKLNPDPLEDPVSCIFYCFQSTEEEHISQNLREEYHYGVLVCATDEDEVRRIRRLFPIDIEDMDDELDILTALSNRVRQLDPDILAGYECHNGSWGYLLERAKARYDYDMVNELSRVNASAFGRFGKETDKWGSEQASSITISGRHLINIWRVMRGELNLLQYTMENVVFHLLHRRIPHYSHKQLTTWYKGNQSNQISRFLKYYLAKVRIDLELLEVQELVMRTSEQARLLGVDFYSVFARGSQFKVESLMFRIAKPECFVLVSPSQAQVGKQNALECLPLVMEPQSNFYTSPLLVLDFQSLYPSVMIAYNYCYSTCLGRVLAWRGENKLGFTDYKRTKRVLELLSEHINIAPNGMMYVKPEIRKSLLAKMLAEILETRVMVKAGMKRDKDDKMLQQLLNNRQLALKLIANVTYGYTSASFSGRLPCSEIADSIVQTARETLEKAIALIHSVEKWGAEVVYGDTDSLFVYLPGRTKDEAFDIGQEITSAITDMNPRPIKLKFEKVYFPCVLLAKKRYVGFKYEHKDQKEPEFDAKGIETVRRDGTPAEQKIEETALKTLFRTADLSQVKAYFQRQCGKIMSEKVSIQDFCFAKEVRLGHYSEKGLPPPGALISTKKMMEDPRAEPQYGERVPYVVVSGAPGARLSDRCVPPEDLLYNSHNRLDAEYYISKNLIPPLERIFNLVGANVRSWYDEMPKIQRVRMIEALPKEGVSKSKTIESFMKSSSCLVCGAKDTEKGICDECMTDSATSLYKLNTRLAKAQKRSIDLHRICKSCTGISGREEIACDSLDCPVFYSRTRGDSTLNAERTVVEPFLKKLEDSVMVKEELEW